VTAATTLADVTTPAGDQLVIPEGWRQGRGAFGGLTIAALIRAIEARVADPARRVRSVTAELPAPALPGVAQVDVDVLRSGSSLTCARAALRQGDSVASHAVAILAASRPLEAPLAWRDLSPPESPPWRELELLKMGSWPEFAQHFEYRHVAGVPLAGGEARTVGWVRPVAPGPHRDAAYLAALVDAWWPAALVRAPAMRPIATIAYTLDVVGDFAGLDPDAPLLYRGTVPVSGDGFFLETRELWGDDGRLLAINHQTFAIIR